jgi:hypothetical protein
MATRTCLDCNKSFTALTFDKNDGLRCGLCFDSYVDSKKGHYPLDVPAVQIAESRCYITQRKLVKTKEELEEKKMYRHKKFD